MAKFTATCSFLKNSQAVRVVRMVTTAVKFIRFTLGGTTACVSSAIRLGAASIEGKHSTYLWILYRMLIVIL